MLQDKFFGREYYLDILEKRVLSLKDGYRQNIAMIGDELVGKTSVIFKFLDKLYDNHIVAVYLEARPEGLASFARRFIGVFLYNFLSNSGMPLEENLDFLIKKSQKYIPRTCQKAKGILSGIDSKKKNNVFGDLLSLSDTFFEETQKFCVFIFDEFHNLENAGAKNLWREWSKALLTQKTTMYIITSSLKFKAKNILSKNLNLLFGNFEQISVEPFDTKTSESYLQIRLGDFNASGAVRNFIVHFTGGCPLYLKLLAGILPKYGPDGIVDTLENLLFDDHGILNQRFSSYLKRFMDTAHGNEHIRILHLISAGHTKIKDIAHALRKTHKELNLRLAYLMEIGAISRSGDFLKINDRVFGFWLKFVYRERLGSLTFDAKNQKESFRNNLGAMVREFNLHSLKPIRERITELLRLFEDEVMSFDKKRLRLNRFREIKPLEFKSDSLKEGLLCRSSEAVWIMAFKPDFITEADVAEFAKECRKYRHKLQRKIIITTREPETNARLMALDEKIWTWDMRNINEVMDLFSRPRVITC